MNFENKYFKLFIYYIALLIVLIIRIFHHTPLYIFDFIKILMTKKYYKRKFDELRQFMIRRKNILLTNLKNYC